MSAGANRQVHIRSRDPKLLKKHVRHIRVVVLAGVNQRLDDVLARLERVHHRRHFYEIWASAYDVKYVHSFSDQRQPRLNYSRLIYLTTTAGAGRIWSGWDGVGTAAVTLVGPIAYFTRVCWNRQSSHSILHADRMTFISQNISPLADRRTSVKAASDCIAVSCIPASGSTGRAGSMPSHPR